MSSQKYSIVPAKVSEKNSKNFLDIRKPEVKVETNQAQTDY